MLYSLTPQANSYSEQDNHERYQVLMRNKLNNQNVHLPKQNSLALEAKYELTLENEQRSCRVTTSKPLSYVTGCRAPTATYPLMTLLT